MVDQPESGAKLIIRHPEERFARRRARVTRRLKFGSAMEIDKELSDGDADGELNGDQLLIADWVAAARPSGAIRISDVIERIIERIIARDNLARPVSPPARMPAFPTPQRAGPSWLIAHLAPFRRRVDSPDEKERDRPVWPYAPSGPGVQRR